MENQLHQLNITYSKGEDRLLLRVSTVGGDEYRVWMTRLYTKQLLSILTQEMEQRGGVTAVASSPATKKGLRQGTYEKRFEDKPQLPLGDQAILAHGLRGAKNKAGVLILSITPKQGKGITLNLTEHLFYVFRDLLTQAVNATDWGLTTGQAPSLARIH